MTGLDNRLLIRYLGIALTLKNFS